MATAFQSYSDFAYFFPPRAEVKIPPALLEKYDRGQFWAQTKFDGSCSILFLDGKGGSRLFNRHQEELTLQSRHIDYAPLNKTGQYMVLAGEYLNKNKKGENGQPFNHKFIIWDILVYEGRHLTGSTFAERTALLQTLYGTHSAAVTHDGKLTMFDCLYQTEVPDVFRAKNFSCNFKLVYDIVTKTELYEGLVLKRKDGKLDYGLRPANNTSWQLKCRRASKNYKF